MAVHIGILGHSWAVSGAIYRSAWRSSAAPISKTSSEELFSQFEVAAPAVTTRIGKEYIQASQSFVDKSLVLMFYFRLYYRHGCQ
jgi:hypothetical protein